MLSIQKNLCYTGRWFPLLLFTFKALNQGNASFQVDHQCVDEESMPRLGGAAPTTDIRPTFLTNFPKSSHNGSLTEFTFLGSHFNALDNAPRGLHIAFGGTPCLVTSLKSSTGQTLQCEARDFPQAGQLPILIHVNGVLIPCKRCSFELHPSPTGVSASITDVLIPVSTGLPQTRDNSSSKIDLMIIILTVFGLFSTVFVVLWKLQSYSKETYVGLQQIRRRIFLRNQGDQQHQLAGVEEVLLRPGIASRSNTIDTEVMGPTDHIYCEILYPAFGSNVSEGYEIPISNNLELKTT